MASAAAIGLMHGASRTTGLLVNKYTARSGTEARVGAHRSEMSRRRLSHVALNLGSASSDPNNRAAASGLSATAVQPAHTEKAPSRSASAATSSVTTRYPSRAKTAAMVDLPARASPTNATAPPSISTTDA